MPRESWGDSRTCPGGCHPGQWCGGGAHQRSVSRVGPEETQKVGEVGALWSSGGGEVCHYLFHNMSTMFLSVSFTAGAPALRSEPWVLPPSSPAEERPQQRHLGTIKQLPSRARHTRTLRGSLSAQAGTRTGTTDSVGTVSGQKGFVGTQKINS